jgi:carboxyl-terminal processing protease
MVETENRLDARSLVKQTYPTTRRVTRPRQFPWQAGHDLPRLDPMQRNTRLIALLIALFSTPVLSAQKDISSGSTPAAQPAPNAAPPLTDVEKLYGLSKIWQEVNYNFAFFDQVAELDWDSTYQAFIPQVLATESTYDYYRVLQRFVALLRDGHTNVYLPPDLGREMEGYAPWLELRNVEGRLLVANVGTSLAGEIPPGSEIVSVDGQPAERYLSERILPHVAASAEHARQYVASMLLLRGPPDSAVRLGFRSPDGATRERMLLRERLLWGDEHRRVDRWVIEGDKRPFGFRWLEEGVGYVELNTFMTDSVALAFEAVLPQLYDARALVIDIRANGGGNSGVGYRVASWLTNDTLATSRWRTREHRAAHKAWGAYGDEHRAYAEMNAWFDGGTHGRVAPASGQRLIVPTAVLLGHATGSAAEDFLVAIDAVPHIITVGQPSFGSTGQPLTFDLPGGGTARVVTKRDTYPDGRDFVGPGVQPDVFLAPTVEDVREGRDVVLERAVELLRGQVGRSAVSGE